MSDRGVFSPYDWKKPTVRRGIRFTHGVLLAVLFLVGLGPVL